jgi:hypothetical protein
MTLLTGRMGDSGGGPKGKPRRGQAATAGLVIAGGGL